MIQPLNILCFGDSLTAGYSQYGMRFTPYSQWLKAKLDVELEGVYEVNAATDGVSGELVTRGFRTRMERQCKVAESPPSPVKSRAGRFWGRKVSSFVEKMEKRGVAVSSRKETEMGSGAAVDKKAEMKIDNSKNAAEDPYDWVIFLGGTNDLGVSHLSLPCLPSHPNAPPSSLASPRLLNYNEYTLTAPRSGGRSHWKSGRKSRA